MHGGSKTIMLRHMDNRVEAFYAAVDAGDLEKLPSLIAPDAVWHVAGDAPISGDHRGHGEIFRLAARVLSETTGTFKTELIESISNGPYSAVKHRWTATRSDTSIEMENIIVFRWDDEGRVAERWEFLGDVDAHDRFWTN
jgi:ketosteroid isomerase-like protein